MKGNINRSRSFGPKPRLSKKNLVMPKTDEVTIYRAEARPNQRLYVGNDINVYGKKKQERITKFIKNIIKGRSVDEAVEQAIKKIKEEEAKRMLFVGIDNPERAEDFLSQSRLRENKKSIKSLQESICEQSKGRIQFLQEGIRELGESSKGLSKDTQLLENSEDIQFLQEGIRKLRGLSERLSKDVKSSQKEVRKLRELFNGPSKDAQLLENSEGIQFLQGGIRELGESSKGLSKDTQLLENSEGIQFLQEGIRKLRESSERLSKDTQLLENSEGIQFLQNLTKCFKKLFDGFSKYNDSQLEILFDNAVHLMHSIHLFKGYLFDAQGQTIRTGVISKDTAENVILQSMTEERVDNSERIPYITFARKEGEQYYVPKKLSNERELLAYKRVKNVDVTKSYNQFGITGDTLVQFMKEIEENVVSEGLTYRKRSRSFPKYLERRMLEQPSGNEKTEDRPSQSTSRAGQSWSERIEMEEKRRFGGKSTPTIQA
ncbi:hypothetical protein [Wolbachia endosymbiont (group A) of Volucella inflata]|uniref:hypothetical protein n=1 Tax=Wolbachia endosymbiont (group A) of Volucella inflata TaxID=2954065 RepID=UPI00222794C4|nr:hypothetical protein [Wolbachia endosymbiont (group A) of Volucella inflata]